MEPNAGQTSNPTPTSNSLKSITFETAVSCNLRQLRFILPFPFRFKDGKLLVDTSPLKRLLWATSLGLVWLRALCMAGGVALCLTFDRFWNPMFFPLYLVCLACTLGASCIGFSVLTCEPGCFAMTWNFILKHKSTVKSPKLLVAFMCIFAPSAQATVAAVDLLLALNPQLVIQFRFVVNLAFEAGFMTPGPTYSALVVIATVADVWSLYVTSAVVGYIATSNMLFLEAWTSVLKQLVESPKRPTLRAAAQINGIWRKLEELVVAIRVFNTGSANAVFASKLMNLNMSISCLSAVILLDFSHNFLFLVIMCYGSVIASIAFPALYHRAYGVSVGLKGAKRELLVKFRQLDRKLEAISPKGIQVGSFYAFERESDLIFWDFIVKQVTSIILL